jgi:predicted transcriptional regulator of viral defense system
MALIDRVIRDLPGEITPLRLTTYAGHSNRRAGALLVHWFHRGHLERVSRGVYVASPNRRELGHVIAMRMLETRPTISSIDLVENSHLDKGGARAVLCRLHRFGRIRRVGNGVYALPEAA